MAQLLAGKFAIVTGGAKGLGQAICRRLAEHGAKLVVVDMDLPNAEKVCASLGGANHTAFKCDVSKGEDVHALVEFARKQHPTPPEVVVNSAGIIRDAMYLDMTEQEWDAVLNTNLKGTHMVGQAFARYAVEKKSKQSIINISSILGKIGAYERANYGAAKAGVIGLTKSAAAALAKTGVRVNALLPGYIPTPMTDGIDDKGTKPTSVATDRTVGCNCQLVATDPNSRSEVSLSSFVNACTSVHSRRRVAELKSEACADIPMGRMGRPEEIADAVLFLASDMSTYMTGAAMEVTGGLGM